MAQDTFIQYWVKEILFQMNDIDRYRNMPHDQRVEKATRVAYKIVYDSDYLWEFINSYINSTLRDDDADMKVK